MFEQILAALAVLQQQVVELQASASAKEQAKYDEGFAAGVVSGGSNKIYSQAEMDQAIAAKDNVIAGIKAAIAERFQQQQNEENASEQGFLAFIQQL